ncbi:ABC transporter ATP-binding protein [Falsochrobactrum sp. TDYN1]|uniref:ABC transporter ATP-binding protein n=1 Tax=Falsochrobactrum tianjinense TaxID=2706015 RepID=A0A949PM52_9HYPH|nr:ABC transporter ATP-binding protein [Falsochrobactrum sp. TDYN1]MBV2143178.1 ABC transporter ATP-binding protein [Falsochrobactrum sp. TDYN1]
MDACSLQEKNLLDSSCPALVLSGISRQFGSVRALDNISIEIQPGEIVCLVGHSGCGKTSLLRIIAGIDAPDSGSLAMYGKTLVAPSVFVEPEKRNIGVVFQDYALFPHLTVRENVLFGLRKMRKEVAQARVDELLDLVGLVPMADRYPHMLSGGEQQRVALIRALAPKPDLLLMDEPFSNLDRGLRAKVRGETMALLRGLGTPVIIVTHEAEEALSIGDRVVLMRSGQVVQNGTARDLHDRPESRYAADFFCDFNVIPGEIRGASLETVLGALRAPNHVRSAEDVLVYLRPRDISVMPDESATRHCLCGRIESRTYLGEAEELALRVENMPFCLRVRTEQYFPQAINRVAVEIDWSKALIFTK